MPSSKELRRRIKSIRSTRQITKAMELVAAAKMRKAQMAALASRTYAKLAWELIQSVSAKAHPEIHKLLRQPDEIRSVGILLITSNRGLIGGFNNNIINKALEYAAPSLNPSHQGREKGFKSSSPPVSLREILTMGEGRRGEGVVFITIGKKGRDAIRKRGYTIAAEFEKKDTLVGAQEFLPVARLLIEDFVNGKYDKVVLVYMDFISTLRQQPRVRELLPLTPFPSLPWRGEGLRERSNLVNLDYLFEPSPDQVLEILLPRLTEMQIYQAYLETDAAEHSARMVAMKNASDAAGDLIDELNLEYNQESQAAITKEISEIVAGKLALQT